MILKAVNVSLALNDEAWTPCLELGTSGHRYEGRLEKILCLQLLAHGMFSPLLLNDMQKVHGQVMEYPILPLLSSPGAFGCIGEGSGGSGCPLSQHPCTLCHSHITCASALGSSEGDLSCSKCF